MSWFYGLIINHIFQVKFIYLYNFVGFLQEALVTATGTELGDLEERCLQLLLEIVKDQSDQKNITCLLSAEQRVKIAL